jgi:hypothetical protein
MSLDALDTVQTVAICDCHDLCSLAAFCLPDLKPPFLAGAKLASMNASRTSIDAKAAGG